ncbi:hypothetical protein [Nesterenkonia natronophila]|uniref:DUF8173 domain-containing protein n=1 Tax=Nesterenkonia natronophila TaxID=2174932 RepID=A0A3A4F8R3_9MICC|nr:hypothetical protein [Nesterenkonia natronophila]RJN32870.1 hypothetical protein D3250_03380 [Nesterenkonia natronophila]
MGSAANAGGFDGMSGASPNSITSTTATAGSGAGEEDGPQFLSGSVIDVSEDIQGDVYVAGRSVNVSGDVSGDIIAAAQTITITGDIDGNVRLAAQDVFISGDIGRSASVFAAALNLTGEGSVGEDLVGAAGEVEIGGDIGRDLVASVDALTIGGTVGRDVTYYSNREAAVADGSVNGSVERIAATPAPERESSPGGMFLVWLFGLLYALVALSLITLLAGLLFPGRLTRVTDQLMRSPWKALLVGFIASIAVPVVLVILLITIIGAPLGLVGILIWLLLTLATFIYGSYFIGRLIFRGAQRPALKAVVGGVILITALHVPWLNIAVWLAMVLFGLGAQLLDFYDKWPRKTHREMDAGPPESEIVQPAVGAEERR